MLGSIFRFVFNKALGAGVAGAALGTFVPTLLGVLHVVAPVAGAVNPALGAVVGIGVAILTWLTPKNKPAPK
jgi:hypothetical protein